MANYIITDNNSSFLIQKGNNESNYSLNDLRITFSEDTPQILKIYDKSVNNYLLHEINLLFDIVDVGGVTVFADAEELYNALYPIFCDSTKSSMASDRSLLSEGNTSDSPLTAGSTFTGLAELNTFASLLVQVSTDQIGVLYVEFSQDGTNWDTSLSFQYNTSRINPPHIFEKGQRYVRIRFTNTSASDQTYFRLNTTYGSFNKLTAPINGTLAENYDATVVRPTDYRSEVAMGKRQGRTLWNKFGHNNDIDIGTEVIASFGGTFTPLTTSTTLTISSTSANDTNGGTGCNSIVIYGIDANRDEVIELVTLNGVSNVVTTSTWLGINRVVMFLCGTSQVNEGTINILATTGGSTMAQVPLGDGVTQQCIFHVPRNHSFVTEFIFINVLNRGKNAELKITLLVYSAVSNGKQEVFHVDIDTAVTNEPIQVNPNLPFPITEKTVLWLECTSDTANVIVNARFSGILERVV